MLTVGSIVYGCFRCFFQLLAHRTSKTGLTNRTPPAPEKKAKMKQGKTAKMPLIPFPVLLNSLTLLLVPVSGHP